MVISELFFSCSINNGITDPLEPITFPYLVAHKIVSDGSQFLEAAIMTFSIIALLKPMEFIG